MSTLLVNALRSVSFRGKGRLLSAMSSLSGEHECRLFGSNFVLDLSDHIQRHMYWGTFEPAETRRIRALLRPGMTVVDVGANVGYYTALAAERVGQGGRVIALEPSPYAFRRLTEWTDRNDRSFVQPLNIGLSDSPGQLNLYLGEGSDNHTPTMVAHEHSTSCAVPVSTLDIVANQLKLQTIDLLKLDVEGWETRVLKGAANLLRERRITNVLCEFNDDWLMRAGSSSAELDQILKSAGFSDTGLLKSFNRLYKHGQPR